MTHETDYNEKHETEMTFSLAVYVHFINWAAIALEYTIDEETVYELISIEGILPYIKHNWVHEEMNIIKCALLWTQLK